MKLIAKATTIILSSMIFLSVLFISDSSALTYSSNAEVGFTFNPTISVNLSGDLLINNLSPGSVSDSNTINVNVATNASQGYVLTATSGSSTTNTDLVNQTNSVYKFSSIATNASLSSLTTDNTWGFSYSEDSGTTWSNYSGLPLDNDDEGATGKQLINTINPADNRTLQFKIAAKASSSQAAGTYQNTINFYAVANPDPTLQPVSCPAGKICYNANSLTPVVGYMGQQAATNGSYHSLYVSGFKNDGYGFAGWSDSVTSNGIKYGPNQDINAPNDIETNGYSLYAMWVPSAGDMQNWTSCSSLAQGEVTALKDSRDNNVYAIAKLTDGKCWMIENLRLDDTSELSSANTNNPSLPLTNVYDTGATSNHLSPHNSSVYSSTNPSGWCDAESTSCYRQSRIFAYPILDSTLANCTNNDGCGYAYGVSYNWYSATAGNNSAAGDICPKGWHLPAKEEFGALDIALGGTGSASSTNTNPTGATMARLWRSYPNNFVDGGYVDVYPNYIRTDGRALGTSAYWSSTSAYYLSIFNGVQPGTAHSHRAYAGMSVRCIAST